MRKTVFVDIDDTLADLQSAIKKAKSINPAMPFPQAEYGFYANLTPLDGAVEAVKWLLNSEFFTPYILTAPSLGRGQDGFEGAVLQYGSTLFPDWKSVIEALEKENQRRALLRFPSIWSQNKNLYENSKTTSTK